MYWGYTKGNTFLKTWDSRNPVLSSYRKHLKFAAERFVRSGWGYECFLSGAETKKNDVAILFDNTFERSVKGFRNPNGFKIKIKNKLKKLIHWCWFKTKQTKQNKTYYPCKCIWPKQRHFFLSSFFYGLNQEIEHMEKQLTITGGDWNVLLNMSMDARNYKSVKRPRARRKNIYVIEKHELADVWREVYPEKRRYTWRKFNTTLQVLLIIIFYFRRTFARNSWNENAS